MYRKQAEGFMKIAQMGRFLIDARELAVETVGTGGYPC